MKTGLSAVIGSWKMKPISAPRIAPHVPLAELEQIAAPVEADRAAVNLAGRLHEPENRQRRHRFAAARFADDAQRFAAPQLEADVIDRPHDAAAGILKVVVRS